MTDKRQLLHLIFLFLLPIVVTWFGISTGGAIALVLLALLWRWAISLSGIIAPEKFPDLELETIAASHFVEKVRWCMDRLGVDYTERQMGGVLGVIFTGRTVPRLKFRTGVVRSVIGNSPEILRYLWGSYAVTHGDKASFLAPTSDRIALEQKIDRYGIDLQVWIYYHVLDDRALALHAWGCNSPAIPLWQRYAVNAVFPVLRGFIRRTFNISDAHHTKAVEHIETTLADVDATLDDGRSSILGGESINYVDISFAAISGLWLQPPGYGGGKADSVRVERDRVSAAMRDEIERWIETYPNAVAFIHGLYETER